MKKRGIAVTLLLGIGAGVAFANVYGLGKLAGLNDGVAICTDRQATIFAERLVESGKFSVRGKNYTVKEAKEDSDDK